jgi:SAM-dependent methyltransferase
MTALNIKTRLGYFFYLIRRNDKTWQSLSQVERELVHEANRLHNNFRPDYAQPELYQGGKNFDSTETRVRTLEGGKLQEFLDRIRPGSVIEVGPGSGFYTHSIVNFPSVKTFDAVDIVQAFLDFVSVRLAILKVSKPGFDFKVLHGDFLQMKFQPVDAIVMLSTVHHIPNRLDLLTWVSKTLKPGGSCFVYEPTHYWPRVKSILGKYWRIYLKASHRAEIENFSTHHFCTLEEFERICQQIPDLKVSSYSFHRMDFPHFTRKVLNRLFSLFKFTRDNDGGIYIANRKSIWRFFSQRMFIEFKRIA